MVTNQGLNTSSTSARLREANKMRNVTVFIVGLLCLITGCHHKVQTNLSNTISDGALIQGVEIVGNKSVTADTIIRQQLHTKPGTRINLAVIKGDIESLYALGFTDVRVEEEPGDSGYKVVRFAVKEK